MINKITRIEYEKLTLLDEDALENPISMFAKWWGEAIAAQVPLLDAIHLSTISQDGAPDARMVLLKGFAEQGFIFYTNYGSAKARQLLAHPHACMLAFWPALERQVRIRGLVKRIERARSKEYFASRPLGAKISAWASSQSQEVDSRSALEAAYLEVSKRFSGDDDIACPPNWGGFCLIPDYFEFWQGRSNRLHDRIQYKKSGDQWLKSRLAP